MKREGKKVDIEHNIEAELEIHETENMMVMVKAWPSRPDQHIDMENEEEVVVEPRRKIIEQRSVNNSDVEEGPTNGDPAARVKLGSKIGILAARTSLAGTILIFNNSGNYREKNLYDKLLLGVLLFMLASFVFGVTLFPVHLVTFPMNNLKSIKRIKFVQGRP